MEEDMAQVAEWGSDANGLWESRALSSKPTGNGFGVGLRGSLRVGQRWGQT